MVLREEEFPGEGSNEGVGRTVVPVVLEVEDEGEDDEGCMSRGSTHWSLRYLKNKIGIAV